jgi:UDPglucose 6-dehydrogenase
MNVAIVGTGYVGLVTAAVLADVGNNVICVDKDESKLEMLRRLEMPIFEMGLEDVVTRVVRAGRMTFTSDLAGAVAQSEIVFIAVGTPPRGDGSTDKTAVEAVARTIGKALSRYTIIAVKSTVPVGTGALVRRVIEESLTAPIEFDVVSNPEFLREGTALSDAARPDRVVIGSSSVRAADKMRELYSSFDSMMVICDVPSAEMIKYASNAFLATKITFANAMAQICEASGADVSQVVHGMGLDYRIGPDFLRAGIGYGGSCFPKDVQSLIHTARELGCPSQLLEAVESTNQTLPGRFVNRMRTALGGLDGKTVAVLGLAFKGQTDDIRESKAINIVRMLSQEGAVVRCYDSAAMPNARVALADCRVTYCSEKYETLTGADAVAVLSEWDEFRKIDMAHVAALMTGNIVFDGRNIYEPGDVHRYGLRYIGVGHPEVGAQHAETHSALTSELHSKAAIAA